MKRFFQSVEKDGSFKKLAVRAEVESHQTAVVQSSVHVSARVGVDSNDPATFVSWNANSLLLRLKKNVKEVTALLEELDPDVIAIQEVRVPAAGRKGESKNQGAIKDDTNAAREDKQTIMRALSVLPLAKYRVWWSLGESKYGGTALFVRQSIEPISIRYSIDESTSAGKHETDGRVILAEFGSFRFLNTYVPNNGWKDEESGFPRRREWDSRMLAFISRPSEKPLIWCGDLNVSHKDADVSHPEFFRNAKLAGYIPPNAEDCGQPGFTAGERRRFSEILEQGDLVDAYRWLNRNKEDDCFTWSGNPVGKYRGKRMRIDYFLVSKKLLNQVISCEILGHGIEQQGFYGSDHCPITMKMDPRAHYSKD